MFKPRRGQLRPVSNEHKILYPPVVEEAVPEVLPAPEADDAPAQLPTTRKRKKE